MPALKEHQRPTHRLEFDGSCLYNGTEFATGTWGFVVREVVSAGRVVKKGRGTAVRHDGREPVSSVQAELQGLYNGLLALKDLRVDGLVVAGDNRLVLNLMTGSNRPRKPAMLHWRSSCFILLNEHFWRPEWVPRDKNTAAHKQAAMARAG